MSTTVGRSARSSWLLPVIVVLITTVTLVPQLHQATSPLGCLLCGEEGLSDAIRNVILFAPLGIALAARGMKLFTALLFGAAFSIGVEGAQFFRLLQASLPRSRYFGQWTPKLRHLEWYHGTVLDASVGGTPIPSWEIGPSAAVRSSLLDGATVLVHAIAGPPVPALGSLFSITDHRQRGILLIGPNQDDLVFQVRPRAADVLLDHPSRRFRGAMDGVHPGDTIVVVVSGSDDAICIALNNRQDCNVGFSAGVGWTFIQNISALPSWAEKAMNALWTMLLMLPYAFWVRRGWHGIVGAVVILLALSLAPVFVHLEPMRPAVWAGAIMGLTLGRFLQKLTAQSQQRTALPGGSSES